jgi:hypothetical protein
MQKKIKSTLGSGSLVASGVETRRRLVLPLVSLACVLASGAALAQEAPSLDEDLQFILDNGFETLFFAQSCRSIGPDGDVIEGESLPVGNGRQLECETFPVTHLQAVDTSASTGERFCALGQLSSVSGENIDPRLSVSVASTPDGGPWVLIGTSDEEITIGRVTGFGGGTAFPLAADALFDVIDIQPNPTGGFCTDLFGL